MCKQIITALQSVDKWSQLVATAKTGNEITKKGRVR
jgi:hypothetical protein